MDIRARLFFCLFSAVLSSYATAASYTAGIRWFDEVLLGYGSTQEAACIDYVSKFNAHPYYDEISYLGLISDPYKESYRVCGALEDWFPVSNPACLLDSSGCTGFASIIEVDVPTLKIKISPAFITSESKQILARLRPANTREGISDNITLLAQVYDADDNIVSNVDVKIESTVDANSGGHDHDDKIRHSIYAGTINSDGTSTLEGDTGKEGLLFRFTSTQVAGEHRLIASCLGNYNCKQTGADRIFVGVNDLMEIPPSNDKYILVGSTPTHPRNHFLTADTYYKIYVLSSWYKTEFDSDPVLHLNDASLEFGGIFDHSASTPWMPPHKSHRNGDIIDIRANPLVNPSTAIPERNFARFKRLVAILGGSASIHHAKVSTQHFHVDF